MPIAVKEKNTVSFRRGSPTVPDYPVKLWGDEGKGSDGKGETEMK